MSLPRIEEWVDVDHYKYVCPENWRIDTEYGDLHCVIGFLSDGASGLGIEDLCKEAFFGHDRLYVHPFINGVRLSRRQCDDVYRDTLIKYYASKVWKWEKRNRIYKFIGDARRVARRLRAHGRYVGLRLVGWKVWSKYRKEERLNKNYWISHVIPKADMWHFPTFWTRDAEWIGDDRIPWEDLPFKHVP